MQTRLYLKGFSTPYEAEHLARIFFSAAVLCHNYAKTRKENVVYARCGKGRFAVGLRQGGVVHWRIHRRQQEDAREENRQLCRLFYHFLCEQTGLVPPWGMLTGVRPVRLLRKKTKELGEEGAVHFLQNQYDVSAEKLQLARAVQTVQAPFLQSLLPQDFSLYISIPFCPTRCSYCSFVSQAVEKEGQWLASYLIKLHEELALCAQLAKKKGLRLRCVYVGGGTPAVLSAAQMDALLGAVTQNFAMDALCEYTVEMGRADCITEEKLAVLHAHGVPRVSVNPQSMTPAVLAAIGRNHTPQEVLSAVQKVRKADLACLNMDLIAGLPGESEASFAQSLQTVLSCRPENLTLHTLTLKRASHLAQKPQHNPAAQAMLQTAYARLWKAGYHPYYLYRQKNTPGNLENTGWCLAGFEGIYNIYIMEEVQSILSVGAGGVTKLVAGQGTYIRRWYNNKVPLEYLKHFEKVQEKYTELESLYAGFLDT